MDVHISEARLHAGLTYPRLAKQAGIPVGRVRAICTGRQEPTQADRASLGLAVGFAADAIRYGPQPEATKRRKGRFCRPRRPATPADSVTVPYQGPPYQGPPAEANGDHLDPAGVEALQAGVEAPAPYVGQRRLLPVTVVKVLPHDLVVVEAAGLRLLCRGDGTNYRIKAIAAVADLAGLAD